jgi:hypothetical protein
MTARLAIIEGGDAYVGRYRLKIRTHYTKSVEKGEVLF